MNCPRSSEVVGGRRKGYVDVFRLAADRRAAKNHGVRGQSVCEITPVADLSPSQGCRKGFRIRSKYS